MVKSGFIVSIKGKSGGFYFDNDKIDVPLKDLIVAIEGNNSISGCGFGLKHCNDNSPCPIHFKYAPIREAINTLISTETIQSLAKNQRMTII